MSAPTAKPAPEEIAALARRIPPLVHFGASSWNYPGWTGMVYHRLYEGKARRYFAADPSGGLAANQPWQELAHVRTLAAMDVVDQAHVRTNGAGLRNCAIRSR